MLKERLADTAMFLLWLAAPAPFVPFASAATLCVAPHGDDSHAGTESQPWKTLYVWLEGGADPKQATMRAAPGHVVSLYDCHHTGLLCVRKTSTFF